MEKRRLGDTDLEITPLVFGGNVFGWNVGKEDSFRLLDRLVDLGFNAVDTADVYSRWADGNSGGESESVLGEWMADRGKRDDLVVVTKVGMDMGDGKEGLSADWIERAVEDSLRRLRTDHIDLYLSHKPDPDTPIEETLEAHQRLIDQGKVRHAGGSNYDAEGLAEALAAGEAEGRARYRVLQPEFNLYDRDGYAGPLEDLCVHEGLGVITYFSLAAGFLTGKYRSEDDLGQSAAREGKVKNYLDAKGKRILAALDEIAAELDATPAQVSLAWLMRRPSVTAPIASATSIEQLDELAGAVGLELAEDQVARLDAAGEV